MTLKEKIQGEFDKLKTYMKNLKDKSDKNIENENNNNIINKFKNSKYFKFWPVLVASIVLIIVFISISFMKNTKQEVLEKFTLAIQNNNPNKLESIIKLPDGQEISKEDVIPILEFFKADINRVNNVKKAFREGKTDYSMSLKKDKKLFGDDYYIEASYATLEIDSNLDKITLVVNGVNKGIFDEDKTIKLIAPGQYNIELENKNEYATVTKNKKIDFTKDTKLDLDLEGTYITISSNIPEATVYINDSSTGIEAKNFVEKGPFPKDGTYQVSLKYNTPFGSVSSEKVPIKDIPDVKLNIDLKSTGIETSLNNLVGKFYQSVFKAIDLKDVNKIEYANDKAKNKIYSDIEENRFILKNVYKLNSSSIDFNKSTIELKDGCYYANVVVSIEYNVKKEILGLPVKSNNYTQNFFTKAKYQDGKWEIYEIENFSLKSAS